MVVWNDAMVTAFRSVKWASDPMVLSGGMLNAVFKAIPKGCHVKLIVEIEEVRHTIVACADIIAGDSITRCSVSWRHGGA
jgi:hypothetical protein